ncbi:uncharacterized protein LOC130670810 [Microplitis mediator]|uniref:uncharacterized protein LOC130670810 n=1 Tax=Microplitis mediator TaxID=375433 RepID=UPI0025549693|nr:uncharacterized protein LOC130670810 [Microplitis mediator]
MTRNCAVKSCGHRQGSKVKHGCTFSKFPNNIDRCRRWLQALGDHDLLGLPFEILSKDRFVCSCHFNDDDYNITKNKKQIKPAAIPIKFSNIVVPLTDQEILEFPPSSGQIIPSIRIEIPTSEMSSLIQPKKYGVLNSIFKKNYECKILEELDPVANEIPTSIACDTADLQDQIMPMDSSTDNDSSSRTLSVLSPLNSESLNQRENCSIDKSIACLKRRRHSLYELSTSTEHEAIDMISNKENFELRTSSDDLNHRLQYPSESTIGKKKITTIQGQINNLKKIVVPRQQWLLFKKINQTLNNLKAPVAQELLAQVDMILTSYKKI